MSVPHVGTPNSDDKSDILRAVNALVDAAQNLQEDAANVEAVENLIERLKQLLFQEKERCSYQRQYSENRRSLEGLQNLIGCLESQVQRARKAAHRRGLKYYLARISNTVLGHEMGRIGQSMGSDLQSWLDQQGVRELANILNNGEEDAQSKAIASFESIVRRGYDSQLQDTILSAGVVERLASLLEPNAAPWTVQKSAAFALSALLDFNKDIFVSLVIMSKVVENILCLMGSESEEHILILVCVIQDLMSAGKQVTVDEIYAHNGVQRLVDLLDHKSQPLQHAAMECVFELAYHGRIEVVEKLLELGVVDKLAKLQPSIPAEDLPAVDGDHARRGLEIGLLCLGADRPPARMKNGHRHQPFANAVTRFALQLAIGTGLRKRERRALKQRLLKEIKVAFNDDAEIANITAEVLWGP